MNINKILQGQRNAWGNVPRLNCKDGLSLSVQAAHGSYCMPRDDIGPWDTVEVGYPSEALPELMPWVEPHDKPTKYGYVPIEIVEKIIEAHGGLV